ncbi:hypothetical protein MTR67_032030 [Solanum verrucosum]|uniref:Secreted protein n=1 Tax=Solanum verrucosum TaxID=315347 RepID=A0AAF0ZH86_SOLVR|nr:hypothetical protein MTR67_032030 [Solanum verrucosum]
MSVFSFIELLFFIFFSLCRCPLNLELSSRKTCLIGSSLDTLQDKFKCSGRFSCLFSNNRNCRFNSKAKLVEHLNLKYSSSAIILCLTSECTLIFSPSLHQTVLLFMVSFV